MTLDERKATILRAVVSEYIETAQPVGSGHVAKTSGINVSPAEVEAFISTIDDVAECVVVGAPDPRKDEVVVAFVLPGPGRTLDPDALIRHCVQSIAAFKVPARVHVVDAMPMTSTGKIARLELRRLAAEDSPEAGS